MSLKLTEIPNLAWGSLMKAGMSRMPQQSWEGRIWRPIHFLMKRR